MCVVLAAIIDLDGLSRMAMKPYRFSNGVTVPEGATVMAPIGPIQRDPALYEQPLEFDGLRFSKMRGEFGDKARFNAVNTNTEFLHFGHGQHAWLVVLFLWLIIVLDDFLRSTRLK